MLEKLGMAMFVKFSQLFFFPNQSDISGRFQTNNNFVFPNRFDALQSQDARRAAEPKAKAVAEAEPVAKAKAASWLNWFGQNRFQKYCGSFIQTQIQGPI